VQVGTASWSERSRRRGRTLGWASLLSGAAIAVALIAGLAADGISSRWRMLLVLGLLIPVELVAHGLRRIVVESSPPLVAPVVLPAVEDPGAYDRFPEPRPVFGLRLVLRSPGRVVVGAVLFAGVPAVAVAWTTGVAWAGGIVVVLLAVGQLWNAALLLWAVPLEVRVTATSLEWRARLRHGRLPLSSLRRVRRNTFPAGTVVLEAEAHPARVVMVNGGFADFLEALTVRCPWIEVSSDVVEHYGSWSGRASGYFVEPAAERS
jgi:hypothetical protein